MLTKQRISTVRTAQPSFSCVSPLLLQTALGWRRSRGEQGWSCWPAWLPAACWHASTLRLKSLFHCPVNFHYALQSKASKQQASGGGLWVKFCMHSSAVYTNNCRHIFSSSSFFVFAQSFRTTKQQSIWMLLLVSEKLACCLTKPIPCVCVM